MVLPQEPPIELAEPGRKTMSFDLFINMREICEAQQRGMSTLSITETSHALDTPGDLGFELEAAQASALVFH